MLLLPNVIEQAVLRIKASVATTAPVDTNKSNVRGVRPSSSGIVFVHWIIGTPLLASRRRWSRRC
jgi:hypothetical protein